MHAAGEVCVGTTHNMHLLQSIDFFWGPFVLFKLLVLQHSNALFSMLTEFQVVDPMLQKSSNAPCFVKM